MEKFSQEKRRKFASNKGGAVKFSQTKMQIIRHLNSSKLPLHEGLALTIGNFDGVHLGHQKIISQLKEQNLATGVLTFEPHPAEFFSGKKLQNFRLTSLAQKLKIFAELGVDYVFVLPFGTKLAKVSATDFVQKILVEKLCVKHLIVGYDFTFGKNREGNFELLQKMSQGCGFNVFQVAALMENSEIFSSSASRKLIAAGKIAEANKILGKNFAVSGFVANGRKLASQLGFPTMNLAAKPQIIQPKFGVYHSRIFIPHLRRAFNSITNFGVKPTIDGTSAPIYETHIPQFYADCYDKKISVELLDFIREEKKFASLDELRKQISQDISMILK